MELTHLPIDIILYSPGACGEMVAAVIDPAGYYFNGNFFENKNIQRNILKYDWAYQLTNTDRYKLIKELSIKYKSIPSHHFNYHVSRRHDIILIDNSETNILNWTIDRIYKIHGNKPWIEPDKEKSLLKYKNLLETSIPKANRIIKLRDILEGRLIEVLQPYVSTSLHEDVYYSWLKQTLEKYPL